MKKEEPVVRLISHNKLCNLENMSATERVGCLTGGKSHYRAGESGQAPFHSKYKCAN